MDSALRRRIAGVFATRVTRFVIGFATSLVMSRILGPGGRGAYALATLAPTTMVTLGQLGLPSAFSFYAGRGRSGARLLVLGLFMATGLTVITVGLILLALPWLESAVLRAAPPDLIRIALLSVPFQYLASFAGATLIGRQTLRNYNFILVGQSVGLLILVVLLVGILDLGAIGAVLANVAVAAGAAAAVIFELRRSTVRDSADPRRPTARGGELFGFGIRIYPASVAGFFGYRADVFLLSAFLGDPRALGLYSLAVSLGELLFFVPDAVGTVLFPKVAATERSSADKLTPAVARLTVLVTALSALGLIPVAFVVVRVALPDFAPSLLPFLVILPGIVALSLSKVLTSYVGGLGMPLRVATASGASLGANLVANVILIPTIGIMGAATASLISYTLQAALLLRIASRLSSKPMRAFALPGGEEVRTLINLARGVIHLARRRPDTPTDGSA
jgi:stage V sporulation protein B